MAAPESNAVTWDAFRWWVGIFGVIMGTLSEAARRAIGSKASTKMVEQAQDNTKAVAKAELNGHIKDDDNRFELYRDRFVRLEDRTREDIKAVAERLEGRMNTIEANQRTNTATILDAIRNNRT